MGGRVRSTAKPLCPAPALPVAVLVPVCPAPPALASTASNLALSEPKPPKKSEQTAQPIDFITSEFALSGTPTIARIGNALPYSAVVTGAGGWVDRTIETSKPLLLYKLLYVSAPDCLIISWACSVFYSETPKLLFRNPQTFIPKPPNYLYS